MPPDPPRKTKQKRNTALRRALCAWGKGARYDVATRHGGPGWADNTLPIKAAGGPGARRGTPLRRSDPVRGLGMPSQALAPVALATFVFKPDMVVQMRGNKTARSEKRVQRLNAPELVRALGSARC